jgi:hypothetical protein
MEGQQPGNGARLQPHVLDTKDLPQFDRRQVSIPSDVVPTVIGPGQGRTTENLFDASTTASQYV